MKITVKNLTSLTNQSQPVANGFLKMAVAAGIIPEPEKVPNASGRGKPYGLFDLTNWPEVVTWLKGLEASSETDTIVVKKPIVEAPVVRTPVELEIETVEETPVETGPTEEDLVEIESLELDTQYEDVNDEFSDEALEDIGYSDSELVAAGYDPEYNPDEYEDV